MCDLSYLLTEMILTSCSKLQQQIKSTYFNWKIFSFKPNIFCTIILSIFVNNYHHPLFCHGRPTCNFPLIAAEHQTSSVADIPVFMGKTCAY